MKIASAAARSTLESLPVFPLCHRPTPLERIGGLQSCWQKPVYMKRDDCTGLAIGGNKTRKLEYTVGHARKLGATVLVTASGFQSNQVRQTAAAAAKAGLRLDALVSPAHDAPVDCYIENGNVLLDRLFGATLIPVGADIDVDFAIGEHCAELRERGERPYVIPLGASDGIGSMGYVRCAWELLKQIDVLGVETSHVFLATGSGGTQAGLLAGLRIAGSDIDVIGVSVSDSAEVKRAAVWNVLQQLRERFAESFPDIPFEDIKVHDEFAGEGYAQPTSAADRWVIEIARGDGILLDPVYTGKSMAGMASLLSTGRLGPVSDPVFIHTGGSPALFADTAILERAGIVPNPLRSFLGSADQWA